MPQAINIRSNKHQNNFFQYFCCPRSQTFLLLEGYIMGLHGDVFLSWDSNISSLVLMGVFLNHLAVQVQVISCTPLSPGWAPAVTLVLWYHCWITTWESDQGWASVVFKRTFGSLRSFPFF